MKRNSWEEVCDRVCMYLQDHSQRCKSHQSEGWTRGLREELWMWGVVADKALMLGGKEYPLGLGRQVWLQSGMHE